MEWHREVGFRVQCFESAFSLDVSQSGLSVGFSVGFSLGFRHTPLLH